MNGKNIKMLLNAIWVYFSGIGFKPFISVLNKQPECVLKIIQLPENEWREWI